jgi:hypothetical protein
VTNSTYGCGIGTGFARDGGKTVTVELRVISGGTFVTASSLAPGIGARQSSLSGRSILPRLVIHGEFSMFAVSLFGNCYNRIFELGLVDIGRQFHLGIGDTGGCRPS